MYFLLIFCLTGHLFVVDLILDRTQPAQGQLTDDLNRSGTRCPPSRALSSSLLFTGSHTWLPNLLQENVVNITINTHPFTQNCCSWGLLLFSWDPPTPPRAPHCLPHNCTADAFASTGALFCKDHLGIFRFWNLRVLACDWLRWPHDNLGRNRSCVL